MQYVIARTPYIFSHYVPTYYSGRFWHATDTIMMRVESFIKRRIPEVTEVILDRKASEIIDDNRLNSEGSKTKKLF